jgi:hypothetical protein
MLIRTLPRISALLVVAASFAAAPAVVAQATTPKPQNAMPSGESLLERYIEKSGGADAYAKAKNMSMTGTVEMAGRNISGTVTILEEGEKSYTSMDFPGIGKVEEGFDGETAWEDSALEGPRILEGDEKAAAKRAATLALITSWRQVYKEAHISGEAEVEGKPAWKVDMLPREGKPETFFFEKDSGLLVRISAVLSTAMGEIATEATMSDFRPVNGILTPFTQTEKAMSQTIIMHFDKIAYNAEIPGARFNLPESVKAKRDRKK